MLEDRKLMLKIALSFIDKGHRWNEVGLKVITLRFGLEDGQVYTLKEIAEMLKRSPERIRQLEARALRLLRQQMIEGYSVIGLWD